MLFRDCNVEWIAAKRVYESTNHRQWVDGHGKRRLSPQNLLHCLSFCKLIDQLVQVSYFLHQRILYFFHADTTYHAFDKRTIGVDGGCLRKKSFKIVLSFNLLLQSRLAVA